MRNLTAIFAVISLLFGQESLASSGLSNARSVGMGGTYLVLARGVEAPGWNPANLGLSDGHKFSVNLISLGLKLHNNSFSKKQYDRYNGAFLKEADKLDILNSIPSDGLRFDLDSETQILGFAYGHFALTANLIIASSTTLSKDYLHLVFFGNKFGRNYVFDDTNAEAWALYCFAFSTGVPIRLSYFQEFSVGASFKYLQGFAYGDVLAARGSVITTNEGIRGVGKATIRHSTGGRGMALDIGAAAAINKTWSVNLGLRNVLSNITWNKEAKEQQYYFSADSITVEYLNQVDEDSIFDTDEITKELDSFGSTLPAELRLGVARSTNKLILALDYTQGFRNAPGVSARPRLSGGVEYRPLKFLPLRTGLSIGGKEGLSPAVGLGFELGHFAFDLAVSNKGGLFPRSARGIGLALGVQLMF